MRLERILAIVAIVTGVTASGLRIAALIVTMIGWISIALLAPLLLMLFGARKYKAIDYLPFAAIA